MKTITATAVLAAGGAPVLLTEPAYSPSPGASSTVAEPMRASGTSV